MSLMSSVGFRVSLLLCGACLVSCAAGPGYLPPVGEHFSSNPLRVGRIAIIANMPSEHREAIAVPLTKEMGKAFEELGVEVKTEIQTTNPLALSSDINIAKASLVHPDGYLIVKYGGGSFSNSFLSWRLRFDLYDEKGQGLWRGSTVLTRIRKMETGFGLLAKEMLRKLLDDLVIDTRKKGEGK